MTIRSKTTLGPLVHEVEWDPADTIVKVARGATENALTLWAAPFKALGGAVVWVLARGGEAVRIDQEREKHL